MGCAHNADYECFDCEDARHQAEHPEYVEGCRQCKFATLQVSPAVKESKKHTPSAGGWNNSWERGHVTDHRGMALLDEHLEPIPVKKYAENRDKYEARRKELATHPDPFGVKTGG